MIRRSLVMGRLQRVAALLRSRELMPADNHPGTACATNVTCARGRFMTAGQCILRGAMPEAVDEWEAVRVAGLARVKNEALAG
jgi:hypothetical protein